jgi:nucleoside-diphosphate-sugar epimerase
MNRVLVTGGTGFIGRHVLKPLIELGVEVHIASRSAMTSPEGVASHRIDLLIPASVSDFIRAVRPTHLLHLAWLSGPGGGRYDAPENELWTAASIELFRTFVRTGGRRAVFAGTCAEYDWGHETLHETKTPLHARTAYGRAKNVVRKATQKLASEAGVSTAWARIFFTFGPHEPLGRLVSDIASALVAGQVVETTAGQQERDYLYVADVASALVALTGSNLTGTINIASGESVPVRRIVNILGVLSGRTDLLAIGARASSSADPQRLVADVTRLRRKLGFTPRYSLEEGLEATLEWWRTELPPESNTR